MGSAVGDTHAVPFHTVFLAIEHVVDTHVTSADGVHSTKCR